MKAIFMLAVLSVCTVGSKAQKNNPFNQRGLDFVKSIQLINNDFNEGKVKDINEETLETYAKMVPSQNQVTLDLATSVVKTLKDPRYNFEGFLKDSKLSDYGKTSVPSLVNFKQLPADKFRSEIEEKVGEILATKMDNAEKELLLTFASMSYNLSESRTAGGGSIVCQVTGPDGTSTLDHDDCVVACALVGGIIGWTICHIPCAIGGAIVGAVVGALS